MSKQRPRLLIADKKKRIYDTLFEAAGMKGGEYFRLDPAGLIKLPGDSELFMLPGRSPVGYDPRGDQYIRLDYNPLVKRKEPCYAVAAFLAPGYTATHSPSYKEKARTCLLPLFNYTAVAFYKGGFYAAGIRVDRERRQQLKGMDPDLVKKNVRSFRGIFPKNRLVRHLETCALVYGCPAAKNFFLKRYEAPLPTSPTCNSECIGCISYQPKKGCPVTQPRIKFVPSPEEVAEVALFHIREVKDPVVSFGQGCEGEPLTVSNVLEGAIKIIRRSTSKGIINLNTNASRPGIVRRLFNQGLDSIRVSINSFRESFYTAYYKPRGYRFRDVIASIRNAKKAGGFVSINYLVMPGFTDSREEVDALLRFLDKEKIDMIQWRNLNYDPVAYFRKLGARAKRSSLVGIDTLIRKVDEEYPQVMKGYFNPSERRIKKFKIKNEKCKI